MPKSKMPQDKVLRAVPTTAHLARLYYELGRRGARTVGKRVSWPYGAPDQETLLALAADMARYDPRLFEALIEWLGRRWREFCPLRLRMAMPRMRTPQVLGVLGAFVRPLGASSECGYFFEYVMRGWPPVPPQLFYHLHYQLGSPRMLRAATEPVAEFLTWGFLAERGPVVRQATKGAGGTFHPAARRNIVARLLAQRSTLTLKDYLAAVQHSISRQQAYLDLKSMPLLRRSGRGRGSRWHAAG
ncbi:MAG: hypothetical protein HY543_00730 [Deltaproteobacteria bacterium]|nr:hypothetical protein [Deltaproteobacteria bacterium]